jgi:dethiobiotin synthetase
VIFVTGIDTGVGKTVVTGLLGKYLWEKGRSVITAKLVQTGCEKVSEDLETHRRIMEMEWNRWDEKGVTCPYVFSYPGSPHLAAGLENKEIQISEIDKAVKTLNENFETVIQEGAGGLMVPIKERYTILDYLEERKYPTVVVSSPKLGSINHTLLTVDALKMRKIPIAGLVYNHFQKAPELISEDSKRVFNKFYPEIPLVEIPMGAAEGDFSVFGV